MDAGVVAVPAAPLPHPRGEIDHGPRGQKRLALTFDACSGPPPGKLDEGVLRELVSAHVPATIFVGGRWAEQDPGRVKALLADPLLELGTHSYHHPHLTRLSDAALRKELRRAIDVLVSQTGKPPRYLRAPYVEADARVVRIARELGLTLIGDDVASGDPDPHFGKARLTRWVLSQARGGSIVVMHINGGGKHTAEALPGIVDGLRAKGYELVTVGQLLSNPAP
ncbi:MAG TPA: polysaccharide deacetylase family protein [Myxococcales bacterium]|nr:polysaccharide deacetylase family protein [Myxococcales bacterium]